MTTFPPIFPDTINMIDYETMDVNFLPFDITSYLIFLLRNHILPGNFSFNVAMKSNGQTRCIICNFQLDYGKSYDDEQGILCYDDKQGMLCSIILNYIIHSTFECWK